MGKEIDLWKTVKESFDRIGLIKINRLINHSIKALLRA